MYPPIRLLAVGALILQGVAALDGTARITAKAGETQTIGPETFEMLTEV
jgi:hypothetical protein